MRPRIEEKSRTVSILHRGLPALLLFVSNLIEDKIPEPFARKPLDTGNKKDHNEVHVQKVM